MSYPCVKDAKGYGFPDAGSNPDLVKHDYLVAAGPPNLPLPDANLRYQDALDSVAQMDP